MSFRPDIPSGGGGRATFTPAESPFSDLVARDTWASSNLSSLFNSTTKVTEVVVNGDLYRWSGDNIPSSYDASDWLLVNNVLDASEVKVLYESNPDTNAFENNDLEITESVRSAPDDVLLLAKAGKLEPSPLRKVSASQVSGQTEIVLSNRGKLIELEQYRIEEAGQTLLQSDKTTGRRNIFCGVPVDFSVVQGDGKTVTGKPYSIDWGEVQPFAAQPLNETSNVGNYSFPAPVTFQRVISQIQFKLVTQTTGVRLTIQEINASGPVIYQSHNDEEWQAGEGLNVLPNGDCIINLLDSDQGTPILVEPAITLWVTIEKFDNPSQLDLIGTTLSPLAPGVFLPFVLQEYFLETRSELVNAKIYTPVYKNALSSDLSIGDLETIAADADFAGGFTLTVDVSEVNTFKVFDYAGRWNAGSRRITVALSNGDNYFLTRRNRNYFFYKDESNNWQWYYTPNFLG